MSQPANPRVPVGIPDRLRSDRSPSSAQIGGLRPWRAALGWLLAGAALGAGLAAWTVDVNDSIPRLRDALLFAGWTALAYGVCGLALGLLASGLLGLLGARRPADYALHAHVALGLLAWMAFSIGSRLWAASSSWATEVTGRSVAAGLTATGLACLLAVGLLRWTALATALARLRCAWFCLLALALAPLAIYLGLPPRLTTEPTPTAQLARGSGDAERSGRVLLVGLDGADWRVAEPLVAAGRLPNWSRLLERGTVSPLESQVPTWSPVIWNSIVTGVAGSSHGILDFTEIAFPGQTQGVQQLRVVERLAQQAEPGTAPVPAHTGLTPLIYAAVRRGWLREEPIQGYHRRVPALRNVLSAAGRRVAVVRWWASWPAEEVAGYVVSDDNVRQSARQLALGGAPAAYATYPPELLERLAELEDPSFGRFADDDHHWDTEDSSSSARRALELPLFSDLDPARRAALQADPGLLRLCWNTWQDDRFGVAAAAALMRDEALDYVAVYSSLIDVLGHRLEGLAKHDPAYLRIIERAYEESDRLLGRLLEECGPETTLLVVSDHGWSFAPQLYGHYHGPSGLLLASGHQIVPQAVLQGPASLYDVAPTVLRLLGVPQSSELPGSALVEMLLPGVTESGRVASFGRYRPRWPRLQGTTLERSTESEIARLRALGYVQ